MALRLTLVLIVAIFLVMQFGGDPQQASLEPENVMAEPAVDAGPDEDPAPVVETARRASDPTAVIRLEPVPEAPQSAERVTLAPPAELTPETEEPAQETPDDPNADPFAVTEADAIAPIEALPSGLAGAAAGGLGAALDLREQVDAALTAAQETPSRPSLAELAQPGGGQTSQATLAVEPDTGGPDAEYAEVTATAVNLRGGPSTLNAVVGRVSRGDVLEVLGEFSGGWSAITHPTTGETAYISSQFLSSVAN